MRRYCIIAVLAFIVTSCNQSRIEELESEKEQLEQRVSSLENQISDLESKKNDLEATISNMRRDMRAIQDCASNASSNARSAAFWADSGDSFLFQSKLRSMSSNFDDIVSIASKY